MDKQISYAYSPALVRRAARQVLLRYGLWFYVFWMGALAFAFVLLGLSSDLRHLSLSKAFSFGALAGGFGAFVFQVFAIYESIEKRIAYTSKKLNQTELVLTFNEQGVFTESIVGSANRFWHSFDRVWVSPNFWFLFNSDQTYIVLPADLLSADFQQFILEKVAEAGGKIER